MGVKLGCLIWLWKIQGKQKLEKKFKFKNLGHVLRRILHCLLVFIKDKLRVKVSLERYQSPCSELFANESETLNKT